jgi:hypothetical protein
VGSLENCTADRAFLSCFHTLSIADSQKGGGPVGLDKSNDGGS